MNSYKYRIEGRLVTEAEIMAESEDQANEMLAPELELLQSDGYPEVYSVELIEVIPEID